MLGWLSSTDGYGYFMLGRNRLVLRCCCLSSKRTADFEYLKIGPRVKFGVGIHFWEIYYPKQLKWQYEFDAANKSLKPQKVILCLGSSYSIRRAMKYSEYFVMSPGSSNPVFNWPRESVF